MRDFIEFLYWYEKTEGESLTEATGQMEAAHIVTMAPANDDTSVSSGQREINWVWGKKNVKGR